MNVGQKTLSDNALVNFGLIPAAGGTIGGGALGVHDKMTNPYADQDTISNKAMMGAAFGLATGGLAASSFRGFRDFRLKQSQYTTAPMNQAQQMVLGTK